MIKFAQVSPRGRNDRRRPACWGVEPEAFFGPADSRPGNPLYTWERRALAVCASCPVAAAYLAEALVYPAAEQYGVVGGMTAGQRQEAMHVSSHGLLPDQGFPGDRADLIVAQRSRTSDVSVGCDGARRWGVRQRLATPWFLVRPVNL
jgi:hypothetical protein